MRGRSRGEEGENRKDRLDEDSVVQRRLFCYPAERAISPSLFLTRLADPLFSPTSRVSGSGERGEREGGGGSREIDRETEKKRERER